MKTLALAAALPVSTTSDPHITLAIDRELYKGAVREPRL
jgi:hypothetical protein